MARSHAHACVRVGVTNARLGADKRGIAVELARRLASTTNAPVCLVGADPTDRDVERRTPSLIDAVGDYAHSHMTNGPHALDITFMRELGVCAVSVSDRTVLTNVFPELRAQFRFIVVDAPSRVGYGVGMAHGLLAHLDALLITSGPSAGDLAVTRGYFAALEQHKGARHVDCRAVLSGQPDERELSAAQLEQRVLALPVLAWVPQLWGRAGARPEPGQVDEAFRPIVDWAVEHYDRLTAIAERAAPEPPREDGRKALQSARAADAYRQTGLPRG